MRLHGRAGSTVARTTMLYDLESIRVLRSNISFSSLLVWSSTKDIIDVVPLYIPIHPLTWYNSRLVAEIITHVDHWEKSKFLMEKLTLQIDKYIPVTWIIHTYIHVYTRLYTNSIYRRIYIYIYTSTRIILIIMKSMMYRLSGGW